MPNQTYRCPVKEHGEFDYFVELGADVPPTRVCPSRKAGGGYYFCGRISRWVPPTVAVIWSTSK